MSDQHTITTDATNVHIVLAWVGNAGAYLLGGMSPLQGVLVIVTLIFTVMQGYILWRDKIARKGQS